MKLYLPPKPNPKLEFDGNWMFHNKEHKHNNQINVKMSDGETVQYKLHISLDYSNYMKETRDIVATFLSMNKIYYKCGGSKGSQEWRHPNNLQYGKMFTLYPRNEEEFFKIVKGMKLLATKYNLKGIVHPSDSMSYMTYEKVVPGTNDTLYYTVEGCTKEALRKSVMDQINDQGYWRENNKGSTHKFENWADAQGTVGPNILYLGGYGIAYAARLKVLNHYWGQGPIDFLFSEAPAHTEKDVQRIGFGTYNIKDGDPNEEVKAIKSALKVGYRHIDTSDNYGKEWGGAEKSVRKAIEESGIPREEIHITTKLDPKNYHRVSAALDESLERLGTDYVDTYLLHWPSAQIGSNPDHNSQQDISETNKPLKITDPDITYVDAWRELINLKAKGKIRKIGVSNFGQNHMQKLREETGEYPEVNQLELHPHSKQQEFIGFMDANNIEIEASAPFANSHAGLIELDEVLDRIAKKHELTVHEVILDWLSKKNIRPIPKSIKEKRQKENLGAIELGLLSPDDVEDIDRISKDDRYEDDEGEWQEEPGKIYVSDPSHNPHNWTVAGIPKNISWVKGTD